MQNYSAVYPYEKFIISLFLWLIVFLVIAILITVLINYLRGGDMDKAYIEETKRGLFDNSKRLKKTRTKTSSNFSEKLGEKIVGYLVDIANSADRALVQDRINKVRNECDRLNLMASLPADNKRIVSTVMVWAKKFSVDRHINDFKILRRSTQIVYDAENRDFKLKISGD